MSRVRAFVQARMSSQRFPGKVLAPFRGRPLIWHVVTAVARALPDVPLVAATSTDEADDPLALYLDRLGVAVFRGDRDDVFGRFQACLATWPCEWILRVCADSPLLDDFVLQSVVEAARPKHCDLVTTRGTFPKGQNAELIRTDAMMAIPASELTRYDREHVTPYFYRNAARFDIIMVESGNADLARLSLVVDEVEDLRRLEATSDDELRRFKYTQLRTRDAHAIPQG